VQYLSDHDDDSDMAVIKDERSDQVFKDSNEKMKRLVEGCVVDKRQVVW
jgi:hypothetical protein